MIRKKGMVPAAYFSYLAVFKELGWKPRNVVQVVGNAPASAGFHKADGSITVNGKRESYCAAWDISVKSDCDGNYRPLSKEQIRQMLACLSRHGFVGWFRDWDGNEHCHIIYVSLKMKPELQKQVRDFLHDRDGLAGHHPETFYTAPKEVDDILRAGFLSANPQ